MELLIALAAVSACRENTSSFPGRSPDALTSEVAPPTPDAVTDAPADTPGTLDAPADTVDQTLDQPQAPDSTADHAPDTTAGPLCGDRRCLRDEFCRAYTFYPGVPGGPPPVTQYTCEPTPPACGTGPTTCACLPQSQCTRPACTCSEAATQSQINCTCAAP